MLQRFNLVLGLEVKLLVHAQEAESASVDPNGPGMGQLYLLSGLQIASQTPCSTFKYSSSAEWGHAGVYASMDTSGTSERRGPVCGKPVSPLKRLPQCLVLESALDGLWKAHCTVCGAMRQQGPYQHASASCSREANV